MFPFIPPENNRKPLYPLKTPENLLFSSVSMGYKMRTLAKNGLI